MEAGALAGAGGAGGAVEGTPGGEAGRLRCPVATRPTTWVPASCCVALAAEVGEGGGRVVVLDGLFGEEERGELMHLVKSEGWQGCGGSPPSDPAAARQAWAGLSEAALQALLDEPPPAMVEVMSRLSLLYHDYEIDHMPPEARGTLGAHVANAAVLGATFSWHQDADPLDAPLGGWTDLHGRYRNREAGKPLWTTLILYLDEEWDASWGAETFFRDEATATGVFVQPTACRAVLLEQDLPHRLAAPSQVAGRPRYSLVWKLLFYPRDGTAPPTICRPEWPTPLRVGSGYPHPAA